MVPSLVFFQGKSGTLYLMHPQTQRREVHQIILQKMPEEDVNAGFIYHHKEKLIRLVER